MSNSNFKFISNGNPDISDLFVKRDSFLIPSLYGWGYNNYGELGQNNVSSRSFPIQVSQNLRWKAVQAGNYLSLIIDSDGTLWGCGRNDQGQLGLNDITNRSSPIQIGAFGEWSTVGCGRFSSHGIKTNGTLWAWGVNTYGQLGLGDITPRSIPTQVGSLTNWKIVKASSTEFFAIKTDGTLWGCGANLYGALAKNNITRYSSPVQIGSQNTWSTLACGYSSLLAIKTDGTLWAAGYNAVYGVLGDGTLVSKSSLIQIGSDTNWQDIAIGVASVLALKTDGTIWSWGQNNYGQLGHGDTIDRSIPTQIGYLNTWKQIDIGGRYHMTALKTDGTLWACGYNTAGELGVGDRTHRSSPVQVGIITSWKQVSCGYRHSLALKYDL